MQTQRGLGASKVSAPSVGGSINIVTKSLDARKVDSFRMALVMTVTTRLLEPSQPDLLKRVGL
jgi:hypothetical protein